MQYLQKNLEALNQTNPQLASRIGALKISPERYQVFQSQQGLNTLTINTADGQSLPWHSRYDPLKEIKYEIQQINQDSIYFPVFLGMGLGYGVRHLWDNHRDNFFGSMIIEKDPCVFRLALENTDLQDILSDNRAQLCIGDDLTQVTQQARAAIPGIMSSRLQLIHHQPSQKLYSDFYNQALTILKQRVQLAEAEFDLMIKSGAQIQMNLWHNLKAIEDSTGLQQVKDLNHNKPAIVVAAGPSLDKNINQLKPWQDKVMIVCVDTAYRTLHNHGIVPDFVIATDPTALNLKHFEGITPDEKTVLAFDPEVNADIPNQWPGQKLFINLDKCEFTRWVEQQFGPYGFQEKGGSVGHTAFLLARDLGSNPIIFTGLDLAFEPRGGKTHTGASSLFREHGAMQAGVQTARLGPRFEADAFDEKIVWVQGVEQEYVPTSHIMSIYIQQFAEHFSQCRARIIDATEGGARLDQCETMSLQSALSQYLSTQPPKTTAVQHLPNEKQTEKFKKQIAIIITILENSEKTAAQGLSLTQKLEEHTARGESLKGTQEWQTISDCFSQLYQSQEIKIALEQALFEAVYQFIQKEKPHQVDIRLKRYRRFFEIFLEKRGQFLPFLTALYAKIE